VIVSNLHAGTCRQISAPSANTTAIARLAFPSDIGITPSSWQQAAASSSKQQQQQAAAASSSSPSMLRNDVADDDQSKADDDHKAQMAER
jgi:hypothetical protein